MYITFFRIDNKFVCSSTYFVIFSRKGQGLASSERATHRQSIAGAGGTHYGVQVTNCQPPQAEAWGYRHGASYGALPLAKHLPGVLSVHPDHLRHSPPEHRWCWRHPLRGARARLPTPRLKPGVIDTAPPTGRSRSLSLSLNPSLGARTPSLSISLSPFLGARALSLSHSLSPFLGVRAPSLNLSLSSFLGERIPSLRGFTSHTKKRG